MTISSRIWELRKKRKLSRRKVAEECLVSVDTLRRWEKGLQYPRVDELERLIKVLNVPIEEALREEG